MKKDGYYSSGEFARMAHVTLRTVRYYDKQDILKPSLVTESGARFYTDEDFARLQQILLLKYLGFSLDDIREMTIGDSDYHFMLNSLNIQLRLVRDRIEQMQLVEKAIQDTAQMIKEQHTIDWSQMLNLIHLTGMEKSLKNQYQNATNISSRINLHSLYSQNKQGWFPWIFEQCRISPGLRILELGCGDGTLWTDNLSLLPEDISIIGFDDIAFSEVCAPGLTTIHVYKKELGQAAVRRLLELIREPGQAKMRIQVYNKLIERGSVARPRAE